MVNSFVKLFAFAGLASAGILSPRQNTTPAVDITALTKNVTATSGTGAVSAAGTLSPFGGIGVGCGINWAEGQSFGGKSVVRLGRSDPGSDDGLGKETGGRRTSSRKASRA